MRKRRLRVSWLALVLLVGAVPASATTMVKRMALDEVTSKAARIVHGTVTNIRSGRDESGMPATWITLDVRRTLKGRAVKQFTFKQAGVAEPLPDGTITRIPGMPRYSVGEEVVIFLHGESARGFTSPVGMGQGTFRVNRGQGAGGHAEVRSDLGDGGKVDLDQFLSTIATLAAH
jgi:hypothetical protein